DSSGLGLLDAPPATAPEGTDSPDNAQTQPPDAASAPQDASEGGIVQAVASVLPATVTVLNQGIGGGGSGSGFIVDDDGHVVTNYHVVQGARALMVVYANGGAVEAGLVGVAPEFDLAVLQVQGPVPATARWGDSTALPLGATVIAIGSALGEYQNTVTQGVLSGFNRSLGDLDGLLQTDAAINHGNSGGPLISAEGEVVGINTMVVRGGQSQAEGLGFAIPSNVAQSVTRQLIERGEVRRPYMGVNFAPLNPQRALEEGLAVTQGALVLDVVRGGPSQQAGLQAGDVIVAVDGQILDERHTLVGEILQSSVGDTLALEVVRGTDRLSLSVTLAPARA
ncbi:MAG TPA: trypsin-like peptidase domain-containing protein, partial [Ardenticatenaceae bacterium]|nr:trypsin-like peptidase domain-containing protein [Ardenticatenaceae bacterium]